MFEDDMIEEFKIEADEMFADSEEGLLNIERGEDFDENFNSIFRSFHSLKGAAGMFGIDQLQEHMHKLETLFENQKAIGSLSKELVDYFLDGVDASKSILNGEEVTFEYWEDRVHTQPEKDVTTPQAPQEKSPPSTITKKKGDLIYVVDDEEFLCRLLENILIDNNYEVRAFTNPLELLKSLENETPALILSDISMPEMSGVDLLATIRKTNKDLPVLFISAHITKKALLESMEMGASGFIEKPFEDIQVINVMQNVLQKAKAVRLLNKSINYILYQFNDLDQYLEKEGKEVVRQSLRNELKSLLELKKEFFGN
jgi:FixJ family two-component response regulator/HPt (histidine-containing phosphotransfer) domain-containing protein